MNFTNSHTQKCAYLIKYTHIHMVYIYNININVHMLYKYVHKIYKNIDIYTIKGTYIHVHTCDYKCTYIRYKHIAVHYKTCIRSI